MWQFIKGAVSATFIDWDAKFSQFYSGILSQGPGAFGDCPPEVDRPHALRLAYLCHLTYVIFRRGESVGQELLAAEETPVGQYRSNMVFFPGDNQYQCFSVCSNTDLVLVFRGSADLRDWLENISGALVGNEKVHAGFDRVSERLWPWVIQTINQRLSETGNTFRRIIFTGHSLGGALAILLSHRLNKIKDALSKEVSIETYTFGCPKIGSSTLKLSFPVFAFRALGDQIPEITMKPEGYTSHGTAYLLADRFRIIPGPDSARMGLINWAFMLRSVAERFASTKAMESSDSDTFDMQAYYFLMQPFPNFCSPPNEMFTKFVYDPLLALPSILYSIKVLMSDEGRTPKPSLDTFEKSLNVSLAFAPVSSHLDNALTQREAMIKLSREKLEGNTIMKGCALLAMKQHHTITNYLELLSLGAVHPKSNEVIE